MWSSKICCVCVLRSVFASCILRSVSWSCVLKYYLFFNKIIILTKNLNISFILFTYGSQKHTYSSQKNPFKLHQNPVTQSILKLQRETHYALSGVLNALSGTQRCKCWVLLFLRPKKTICLANEKVYIFAWNLSFSALGTCIQFS